MTETELRAELETISTDRAWADEMVAAMTPAAIDSRDIPDTFSMEGAGPRRCDENLAIVTALEPSSSTAIKL
jgi:hypothetical protein